MDSRFRGQERIWIRVRGGPQGSVFGPLLDVTSYNSCSPQKGASGAEDKALVNVYTSVVG